MKRSALRAAGTAASVLLFAAPAIGAQGPRAALRPSAAIPARAALVDRRAHVRRPRVQGQAGCTTDYDNGAMGANGFDYFVGNSDSADDDFAGGANSAVVSGFANEACEIDGAIVAGAHNEISTSPSGGAQFSFIGGGESNGVESSFSAIGGGVSNVVSGQYSIVGGGYANTVGSQRAAVVGGSDNTVTGSYGFIGAGYDESVSGSSSFIGAGGGDGGGNSVSGYDSFVGTGDGNVVSGGGSFIGAGGTITGKIPENSISGNDSFIGSGDQNSVLANEAFVGSGAINSIASGATYSSILGGSRNSVSAEYASILGGYGSVASGSYAIVAGGDGDTAGGILSFAAGYHADAVHSGSFVWSDYSSGSTAIKDKAANQFVVRASGGTYVYSNEAATSGVVLTPGSGAWANLSDRHAKTGVSLVDDDAILAKVAALPVSTWRYTSESGVRHVGPMAQDFYAAFGVGVDDRHITSIDEDGVALAAIKGLDTKLKLANASLHRENDRLRSRLAAIEARDAAFERRLDALARSQK